MLVHMSVGLVKAGGDRNYTLSHYRIVFTAISSVCPLIILLNFMHSEVGEDDPSSIYYIPLSLYVLIISHYLSQFS